MIRSNVYKMGNMCFLTHIWEICVKKMFAGNNLKIKIVKLIKNSLNKLIKFIAVFKIFSKNYLRMHFNGRKLDMFLKYIFMIKKIFNF